MLVTTIGVVSRADALVTEGRMLQGVHVGLVRPGHEPKLCGVSISMIRAELGKVVRGIRPRT